MNATQKTTNGFKYSLFTRGAHYIIGYPILSYITLYFGKLYYILYFYAYTIYSLVNPILYGKGKVSACNTKHDIFTANLLLCCDTFYAT